MTSLITNMIDGMESNTPSHEFMVRQAVMNAVRKDYHWPLRVHHGSVAGVLRGLRADEAMYIPGNLIVAITQEFQKLEKRFERAA